MAKNKSESKGTSEGESEAQYTPETMEVEGSDQDEDFSTDVYEDNEAPTSRSLLITPGMAKVLLFTIIVAWCFYLTLVAILDVALVEGVTPWLVGLNWLLAPATFVLGLFLLRRSVLKVNAKDQSQKISSQS